MSKYLYMVSTKKKGNLEEGIYLVPADTTQEAVVKLLWAADDGELGYQEDIQKFAQDMEYKTVHNMCENIAPEHISGMYGALRSTAPLVYIENLTLLRDTDRFKGLIFNGELKITDEEDFNKWMNE